MKILRTILYLLLVLQTLGWAVVVLLVISSLRPEPGANLVLMGVPLVGVPMAPFAILLVLLAVVAATKRAIRPWETCLFCLTGAATFLAFAIALLLS